jgi:hypothetical protein
LTKIPPSRATFQPVKALGFHTFSKAIDGDDDDDGAAGRLTPTGQVVEADAPVSLGFLSAQP